MKDHPASLDEQLRRRLSGAEVPPPPAVWPAVERALRRRRRRIFLFWWFLLAGITGAFLGLWWKQSLQPTSPVAHHAPTPPTPKADRAVAGPAAGTGNVPGEVPVLGGDDKPALTPQYSTPFEEGHPSTAPKRRPGYSASIPNVTDAHATRKGRATEKHQAEQEEVTSVVTPSDIAVLRDINAGFALEKLPVQYLPGMLAATPQQKLPAKIAQRAKAEKPAAPLRRPKNCYDFSKHPNAWVVEAFAGPTFVQKNLAAANPAFENLREQRLLSERNDWGFNAGVRVMRIMSRNFTARTGLHYEQFVEIFEHLEHNVRVVKTIIDPVTGEPVIVSDETVAVYRKNYNRFGTLDIPLQVGMELRAGRVGVSLQTGVSINMLFWRKGLMLNEDEKPAPFESAAANEAVFKPSTGLSMISNMQFFTYLNTHTRLFVEPYYRSILKPVSVDSAPLEQRYGMWGIQLGVSQILK